MYNLFEYFIRRYIVVALSTLFFTLYFQGYNDFLWTLLLPLVVFYIYKILVHSSKGLGKNGFVFLLFFTSLLLRIVMVFVMEMVLLYYNDMPFLSFKDDYIYNEAAIAMMNRWKLSGFAFYDDLTFSSNTYAGFPTFSAFLMYFFGPSHIVPRLGNAVLSSITVVLSYYILKLYTRKERLREVSIILVVFPLSIIISSLQFKDTLLLFLMVMGLLSSICILQGKKVLFSLLMLLLSYVGCAFSRPAVIVPMALALVVMVLRNVFTKHNSSSFVKIISLALVAYLLLNSFEFLSMHGFVSMDDYFESRYYKLTELGIQDTEANIRKLSISNYAGAPLYMLLGLFLPPPLIVAIDETINYSAWTLLFHFAFLPYLIIAMWYSIINRKNNPTAFFLFLVYLFLRIGQASSLMTSFSPRQSLATLFIMYLLLPMYKRKHHKWEVFFLVVSVFIMSLYNLVRLYSHGLL